MEGLRARWSGNTQRAALLQARAAAITAAQQYHHQQQQQQMALPKVGVHLRLHSQLNAAVEQLLPLQTVVGTASLCTVEQHRA